MVGNTGGGDGAITGVSVSDERVVFAGISFRISLSVCCLHVIHLFVLSYVIADDRVQSLLV